MGNRDHRSDEILVRDRPLAVRARAARPDFAAEQAARLAAANAEIALLARRAFVDGRLGTNADRRRIGRSCSPHPPIGLFAGIRAVTAPPRCNELGATAGAGDHRAIVTHRNGRVSPTHAARLARQAVSNSSGVQSSSSEWSRSELNHDTQAQIAVSRSSSPFQ